MSYLHPRKVFAMSCESTVQNNLQKHDSDTTTIRCVQSLLKGKFHERLVLILLHAKRTEGGGVFWQNTIQNVIEKL